MQERACCSSPSGGPVAWCGAALTFHNSELPFLNISLFVPYFEANTFQKKLSCRLRTHVYPFIELAGGTMDVQPDRSKPDATCTLCHYLVEPESLIIRLIVDTRHSAQKECPGCRVINAILAPYWDGCKEDWWSIYKVGDDVFTLVYASSVKVTLSISATSGTFKPFASNVTE